MSKDDIERIIMDGMMKGRDMGQIAQEIAKLANHRLNRAATPA